MPSDKRENLNGRTLRIKAVARKLLTGKGRKSVGAAMREVGYSDNYADSPTRLTKSKAWKEILEEYLPDELIARVHKEQFEATDIRFRGKKKIEVPDNSARARAIEMGYKLRGRFAAEKIEIEEPLERLTNSELAEKIAKLKAHLLKKPAKK